MCRYLLIVYLTLLAFAAKSQTIENVDYSLHEDKILVYYDINNCNQGLKCEIDLKFVDENGKVIIPRNLLGDFGLVSCGKNKKIIWDLFKEVESLEGNYKVKVSIVKVIDNKNNTITKVLKNEEIDNQIYLTINKGVDLGTFYSVYISNKLIGITTIVQSEKNESRGILKTKKEYSSFKNKLLDSKLYDFKKNQISLGFGYQNIKQISGQFLKLDVSKYVFRNFLYAGLDMKYYHDSFDKSALQFSLKLGITPMYYKNKNLHLGFNIPIYSAEISSSFEDGYNVKSELFVGYQYKRSVIDIGIISGNPLYLSLYDYDFREGDFKVFLGVTFSYRYVFQF